MFLALLGCVAALVAFKVVSALVSALGNR